MSGRGCHNPNLDAGKLQHVTADDAFAAVLVSWIECLNCAPRSLREHPRARAVVEMPGSAGCVRFAPRDSDLSSNNLPVSDVVGPWVDNREAGRPGCANEPRVRAIQGLWSRIRSQHTGRVGGDRAAKPLASESWGPIIPVMRQFPFCAQKHSVGLAPQVADSTECC